MLETWARDGQRPDKPHVLRVGIATPTGPWNARQQRGRHATPFHPSAGEPCPNRAETPDLPLSREREKQSQPSSFRPIHRNGTPNSSYAVTTPRREERKSILEGMGWARRQGVRTQLSQASSIRLYTCPHTLTKAAPWIPAATRPHAQDVGRRVQTMRKSVRIQGMSVQPPRGRSWLFGQQLGEN